MSSNLMTGFCRITVVAPDVRVDMALPEDVPLAELLPDVLRMADQWQSEGAHSGFVLARLDGSPLDTGGSLTTQGVRSGDLLYLRPATATLPPPVYDDVVDAIAQSVAEDGRMWGPAQFRRFGLIAGGAMFVLGAWTLWSAGDPHGLPAAAGAVLALVLTAAAGTRSRVYGDHAGAAILGASALPYAFLAGIGLLPLSATAGLGRAHFIVGCCTVLVIAVAGTVLLPEHDEAYLAAAVAAAAGAVAGGVGLATSASPAQLAAGTGTVAVAAIGFLPGFVLRAIRFPMPHIVEGAPQLTGTAQKAALPPGNDEPVDTAAISRRAHRAHEVLTGLTGACALVITLCAAVLAFSTPGDGGGPWATGMAAVLAAAALSRARLFRRGGQVGTLVWGGAAAAGFVVLGAVLNSTGADRRTVLFCVALALGLILLAVGLLLPNRTLSPRWARTVDLVDGLLLAAVIPVLLGVLGVYSSVRTGGVF